MPALSEVVHRYWGYTTLRSLQSEAMVAAVNGRDSLVVLPTGGGKSLCYQAPALLSDKPTVVVSPLIALMKDQVDRLIHRNIPAAFLNSSLDTDDRRRVTQGIGRGEYKLIFVAPERFASPQFLDYLEKTGVGSFAIDEAHCISHWGHDFRSDYRRLGMLKKQMPEVPVHAFTATATPRVRDDIVTQLSLNAPLVLVGDFFRPNLHYRIVRRTSTTADVLEEICKRPGRVGIVYCIRRKDVDEMTTALKRAGIRATGYHAGMDDAKRTQAQDAFAAGRVDVVVATVAFGMGIDRADIRFVIHSAMPKSIEHYQQETGRAGRDGKPADCILFYNGSDFRLWEHIIGLDQGSNHEDQMRLLSEMYRLCTGARCRHRQLISYFGQDWNRNDCKACDVCTGELKPLDDSSVVAQKIMSCVMRVNERFGSRYVADVLLGKTTERIVQNNHQKLSTFGLLSGQTVQAIVGWIDQLVDQGLMQRVGEYHTLAVTLDGWRVLQSQVGATLYDTAGKLPERSCKSPKRTPAMAKPPRYPAETPVGNEPLDFETQRVFERLRTVRRKLAEHLNLPAFCVFSDKTLREIARTRPTSFADLLTVHGVGTRKCDQFGQEMLDAIRETVFQPESGGSRLPK